MKKYKVQSFVFKDILFVIGVVICGSVANDAYAQTREGFIANGSITAGHDDNMFRSIREVSDSYLAFTPVLTLNSLYGKHNFSAVYKGNYKLFSENSDLNYLEHDINLRALFDHSTSFNTEFSVFYRDQIEAPGVNNSAADLLILDFQEFTTEGLNAKFSYGTRESIGQFVLSLGASNEDYKTARLSFRDVDRKNIAGTFFYNLGTKTRLLFESSFETFDYENSQQDFDQSNEEVSFLLGAEWLATAASSGSLRLGYQEKDYDQEQFKTIYGLTYILNLNWQPNTFTKLSLNGSKRPRESAQINAEGFFVTTYGIGVEHELTARAQIVSSVSLSDDDISSERTDTRQEFQFGVNYSVNRWLNTRLNYRHSKRESDEDLFNFNANVIELVFSTSFD